MTRYGLAGLPLALTCTPLLFLAACTDDGDVVDPTTTFGTSTGDGDGDPTTTTTGDGDGDPATGDGDGDPLPDCEEGEEQCTEDGHQICEGGQWTDAPCDEGSYCDEPSGTCMECACTPGEVLGCADDDNLEVCNAECTGTETEACGLNTLCLDGVCEDIVCAPDLTYCTGPNTFQDCNDTGTAFGEEMPCPDNDVCLAGECLSPCAAAEATRSNIGCEFWAVDMANLPPRDAFTYSIVVANPSETTAATVQIWDKRMGFQTAILEETIQPRQTHVFNVSGSHNIYTSYYNGMDAGILGSGIAEGTAFRVESDLPVVATQFNPIGGASGATSGASLLLPTHVLGTDYLHMDWDRGFSSGASLNIIATENDTQITITPTEDTQAGSNGLPAMNAGQPTVLNIDAYDYIQVSVNDLNLTGSSITANKPIAVFGGHSCANVPDEGTGYCDHIEEQIFPLETWGENYVAARNPIRQNEPMRWRVLASEDNTTVNFDPAVQVGNQIILDEGEWAEFDSMDDFFASADKPILVAGYMLGSQVVDTEDQGDPFMVLMVPVEQYQDDYVLLVDDSYSEDFIKLIRTAGQEVTVECLGGPVPENRWTQVGNTDYEWAEIDVNPGEAMCETGTNVASSDMGFGAIVMGQGNDVSYAYPGGLALEAINPL